MARKRIQISKTSYNSSQYNNLVDSEFTSFTDPVLEEKARS